MKFLTLWAVGTKIAGAEIQHGGPAADPALTGMKGPKLLVTGDAAIKDLILKIELILPDVARASQDLRTLRNLLEREIADAAALRSKSLSSYQQVHIPSGLQRR